MSLRREATDDRRQAILITAGPTIEPIDPVRCLSNYSTGRMGYELARAARDRGYKVILISGPTALKAPKRVRFVPIKTAEEMRRETLKFFRRADCVFMAAAVSDFRPAKFHKSKIKKLSKSRFSLKLKRNPDILSELGRKKGKRILVGYSLETVSPIKSAQRKLVSKGLDVIAVSKIGKRSDPFGKGAKDITIIDKKGNIRRLKGASKAKMACILLDFVLPTQNKKQLLLCHSRQFFLTK